LKPPWCKRFKSNVYDTAFVGCIVRLSEFFSLESLCFILACCLGCWEYNTYSLTVWYFNLLPGCYAGIIPWCSLQSSRRFNTSTSISILFWSLCFGHNTFSVVFYNIVQIYTCKLSWLLGVQDLQSDTIIYYQAVNRHCPLMLPAAKPSIQHFEQLFSL
jgi:hypothetical protein